MFMRLVTLLQSPRPSESIHPQVIELARSILLQENTANLPGATHIVTSTALLTLETLVGAAKGCPILPLQAASSVVFLLLQTFETAKSNNDDLVRLANDACEIIVMVIRNYQNEGTEEWRSYSDMTTNQKEALTQFVDKIYRIYKNADRLSKRHFFIKFVSARVDVGAIRAAREALDHAISVFDLVLQISIKQDIARIFQCMDQIRAQRSEATLNPLQANEATPPSTVDLLDTTISPRLIEPPLLTSAPPEDPTERPISTSTLPDEPPPASTAGPSSAGPPRTTSQLPPVAVSQIPPSAPDKTMPTAASPSAASPSPRAITLPHSVATTALVSPVPQVVSPLLDETISTSIVSPSAGRPSPRAIGQPHLEATTSGSSVSQVPSPALNNTTPTPVSGPSHTASSPSGGPEPWPSSHPPNDYDPLRPLTDQYSREGLAPVDNPSATLGSPSHLPNQHFANYVSPYPNDPSSPMRPFLNPPPRNPDHQSPSMDPTPPETNYGAPRQSRDGRSPIYTHPPILNQHPWMRATSPGCYPSTSMASQYIHHQNYDGGPPMFSQYSTPSPPPSMGHTPPWSHSNPPVATTALPLGSGNISFGNGNISAGKDNNIGTYGGIHQTNYNSGNAYNDSVVDSFNDNIRENSGTR